MKKSRVLLPDQARIIGKQLIRSTSSVGANTWAAFRSRSTKEFATKLGIAVEELALVKDNNKVKIY